METKINIAKILKNKPEGTKLWTDMFGSVTLYVVTDACDAFQVKHHNKDPWFDEDGKLYKEGVLCIYPSKSMRNWEKFSWKKGDVLISDCGFMCIFKEWASDDYTKFNGCYFDGMPNTETAKYSKVDNNIAYGYIRDIENRCGGKLNLETLEIEKKTKFEDGDIAFADYGNRQYVFIVSGETGLSEGYNSSIYLDLSSPTSSIAFRTSFFKKDLCELRLATEEEKKQLFDALEKEGKRWDSDKKAIVDLKPKVELKPFDKVLVRDFGSQAWQVSLFSYKDSDSYYCCNGCGWNQCIPYNEKTAHLLGTTGEWKGGEG